jgi:hypothetical protein
MFGAAWNELQVVLGHVGKAGVLLGVSGWQVLLDGVPLEARPTDRSFAQLLSSAGLSSIHFSPGVTREDFSAMVQVFAARRAKIGPLTTELKAALTARGEPTIRINEIRFVAQDAALDETTMAAQVAIQSLGRHADTLQSWLNDPRKLLQLVAAAEGAKGGPGAPQECASGELTAPLERAQYWPAVPLRDGAQGESPGLQERASPPGNLAPNLEEADVMSILRLLSELGQAGNKPESRPEAGKFHQQLTQIRETAQQTLTQALASLAAASPNARMDTPLLVQLAEHIAIRFALERFERGDASVNAVMQLINRMKREVKTLRKILEEHEQKMGRAGLEVEAHSDILDREFWAALPEFAKRNILTSEEAWAIPPINIRQFVGDLLDHSEDDLARDILLKYAASVRSADPDARRKTYLGLTDLADLYVRASGSLLQPVISHMGEQLKQEQDAELQTLLGACFVRFSHEAAAQRQFQAVKEALVCLDGVEQLHPGLAQLLWPRIKVGNRTNEFIDEAVRAPQLPEDLMDVLRRTPHETVEYAGNRLARCARREERDRLVVIVHELGQQGVAELRELLTNHPPQEAVSTVALLTRLEPRTIEELLPERLREWDQLYQDQAVQQLALSGAPERGKLLLNLLDVVEPVVQQQALDEIGMSGERSAHRRLLNMIEEGLGQDGDPLLSVKAIEALGRLRDPNASTLLRSLVEAKQLLRWRYPREIRITAAQALQKIDTEWSEAFLPKSGLAESELDLRPLDAVPDTPWVRQRRYERIELSRTLTGLVSSPQGDCPMTIQGLSLGGGMATCQRYLKPGLVASIVFRSGLGRVRAEVVVREARPQQLSFELVKIALEDRNKLRRPLAQNRVQAA